MRECPLACVCNTNNMTTVLHLPLGLAAFTLSFHFVPGASNLLYVRRDAVLLGNNGSTCVSVVEVGWMILWTGWLLIDQKRNNRNSNNGVISLGAMNWMWFGAALLGPFVLRRWRNSSSSSSSGSSGSSLNLLEVTIFWAEYLGSKAAWPALWNLGLIALLSVAAPLYAITDDAVPVPPLGRMLVGYYSSGSTPPSREPPCSHSVLRKAHVQTARYICYWLMAHAILLTFPYALRAPSFASFGSKMLPMIHGGKVYYTEGIVNFVGWIALLFLGGLWMTATWLREPNFEAFQFLHCACAIGFFLFSNLHDYSTLMFVWPGIVALLSGRIGAGLFHGDSGGVLAVGKCSLTLVERDKVDGYYGYGTRNATSNNHAVAVVSVSNNTDTTVAPHRPVLEVASYPNVARKIVRLTTPIKIKGWPTLTLKTVRPGMHLMVRDKSLFLAGSPHNDIGHRPKAWTHHAACQELGRLVQGICGEVERPDTTRTDAKPGSGGGSRWKWRDAKFPAAARRRARAGPLGALWPRPDGTSPVQ